MARLLLLPGLIIAFLFIFFLAAQSGQTSSNDAPAAMEQTESDYLATSEFQTLPEPDENPPDQPKNPKPLHSKSTNETSFFDILQDLFSSLGDVFTNIARLDQQVNETIWDSIPSEGSFLLGIYSSARCLLTLFGFFTLVGLVSIWKKITS